MSFEGIVVFAPPAKRSFVGSAEPGTKEWLELSQEDLLRMLPQFSGIPVRTEHGDTEVGRILEGFFTPDGHAAVRFK
jgi:hypothetical protein